MTIDRNAGIVVFFVAVSALTIANGCATRRTMSASTINDTSLSICLKWNRGFTGEPWSNVSNGFLWSLSYLGASLPTGCSKTLFEMKDSSHYTIHLKEAGFNEEALRCLRPIISHLKQSAEYRKTGAIDFGRFIVLTLYSSNHYYAITKAERRYATFANRYLADTVYHLLVNHSSLTTSDRFISFSPVNQVNALAMVSEDGMGYYSDSSFRRHSYECWSIMPNGMIRYAIYGNDGELKQASDGPAGKPGKCMWCHETALQPLFKPNEPTPGFMKDSTFSAYIKQYQLNLDAYRKELTTEVDFTDKKLHTLSELLYITFMEPSAERISSEWNLPINQVALKLSGKRTHINQEYPWMGLLYSRSDVDKISPFSVVPCPQDVREKSTEEPDFLHFR